MNALDWVPPDQQAAYHARAAAAIKMAYQIQGLRAFESTKRCAALHEAGHCVVYWLTADQDRGGQWWRPDNARIWRAPVKGFVCWVGETVQPKKAPPFCVDARTDLPGYLTLAARTLGGIAAELAFDADDYRAGSSMDEWLIAGGCARSLEAVGAFPTAEKALAALLGATQRMLLNNESAVRAIARQLESRLKLDSKALTALLREVRPRSPSVGQGGME